MPTFVHGKNTHFALGTAATKATTVDISESLDSVDFPEEIEQAETTTFSSTRNRKTYISGFEDGTISVSGKWNSGVDEHLHALKQVDEVAFDYGPAGGAAGAVKYSGTCFMTNYSRSSPVGDVTSFSATFQIDSDDVTRDTFS